MRVLGLFLAFVSFSFVASAQLLDDGVNYPIEKGEANDPLYGNQSARTMSQREYSQFFEQQVVRPALEVGFLTGAIAVNLKTGDISICEKAPEPSSLSLLALAGVWMALRRKRL